MNGLKTVKEIAEKFNVSPATIYWWISALGCPCKRIHRGFRDKIFMDEKKVEKWVKEIRAEKQRTGKKLNV